MVSQRRRGFNWPWRQMSLVLSPELLYLTEWHGRRSRLQKEFHFRWAIIKGPSDRIVVNLFEDAWK